MSNWRSGTSLRTKKREESDDEDALGVEDGEEPGDDAILSLGYADY